MLIAQLAIDGLAKGAIYASLALALVVVHRSTGLVNFAQGEFATLSVMFTAVLTTAGMNVWAALGVSVVVSFLAGAAIQRFLVRYFMGRSELVIITLLIGLYISANGLGQIIFGPYSRPLASLFPEGQFHIGDVRIRWALIGVILLQVLVVVALTLFFDHTKAGLAFRAVATGPAESRTAGLPVGRVHMLGWGLAAAIGAVAGVSLTSLGIYVEPSMMGPVLVFSFAAITIGGFDSAAGAIVGGIIMGLADSVITTLTPAASGQTGLVIALVVIVVVLLARPQGLFGRKRVSRA